MKMKLFIIHYYFKLINKKNNNINKKNMFKYFIVLK